MGEGNPFLSKLTREKAKGQTELPKFSPDSSPPSIDKTPPAQIRKEEAAGIAEAKKTIDTIDNINLQEKLGITYDAAEWLNETTVKVGDKTYTECTEIGNGGNGRVFRARDENGNVVGIKESFTNANDRLESVEPFSETNYGVTEEILQTRRDELPLALIQQAGLAKTGITPKLYQLGRLENGTHVLVKEFVEGDDFADGAGAINHLRSRFWTDGENPGEGITDQYAIASIQDDTATMRELHAQGKRSIQVTDTPPSGLLENFSRSKKEGREKKDIIKKIEVFKASLLLALKDILTAFEVMQQTHMYHPDLKMADYIISPDIAKGMDSAHNLEEHWRGTFIDWGNIKMRTDFQERPAAVQEKLLADLLVHLLKEGILPSATQAPALPIETSQRAKGDPMSNEDPTLAKIIKDQLNSFYESFGELYTAAQTRYDANEEDLDEASENFKRVVTTTFEKMNQEAKKIGLQARFNYPTQ